MTETLALFIGTPIAYLVGLIVTMRVIIVNAVRDYCEKQYATCDGCKKVFYNINWDSPATAVNAIHSCDWVNAWVGGIFWPVVAPLYLVVKPARSFILRMPEQKLTSTERERLAELELRKATDEMNDAKS